VSDELTIQSHRGPYTVHVRDEKLPDQARFLEGNPHFLIDANVARLYQGELGGLIGHLNAIVIEATEPNKSIERTIPVFERLVANKIRRGDTLVAIGGGIIQDVCCFIASTLLRGLDWRFIPTTLLAQADSCIGSKSSINLGATKNIIGTFNPPKDVFIHSGFLDTLDVKEIHSGVGEMLKVHVIDGPDSFDRIAADFDALVSDRVVLRQYTMSSLRIKKRFIEEDEFDRGIRNVFNYGHSFGHAIESATSYGIPHGTAISIGMDMANFVAAGRGMLPPRHSERMHPVLRRNYEAYRRTAIPFEPMLAALMKDKKNTAAALGLILPLGENASVERVQVPPDDAFRKLCSDFLGGLQK
jgi:3-dehydroquinate synthase